MSAIVFKAFHRSTCREVAEVSVNTGGVIQIWVAVYKNLVKRFADFRVNKAEGLHDEGSQPIRSKKLLNLFYW